MAYLDENGLARFKSKLDDQLDERIEEQSEETSVLLTHKLDTPVNIPQGKYLQTDTNGQAVWGDIPVDTSLNVTGAAAESKTVGTKLNNQILVQDSQPSSPDNKIWIKETPQSEVQVPTYTEFTDLQSALGTVPSGKTAQGQITDNASDIADLESAIDSMPTEETGQELLLQEIYNTGLTDTALTVIGMIFNNLPQDEPAVDIVHSLELECERLQAIYENWMSERSA